MKAGVDAAAPTVERAIQSITNATSAPASVTGAEGIEMATTTTEGLEMAGAEGVETAAGVAEGVEMAAAASEGLEAAALLGAAGEGALAGGVGTSELGPLAAIGALLGAGVGIGAALWNNAQSSAPTNTSTQPPPLANSWLGLDNAPTQYEAEHQETNNQGIHGFNYSHSYSFDDDDP